MLQRTLIALTGTLLSITAAAQNPIQWSSNPEASIAAARRFVRPLLFLVPFDSRGRSSLLYLGQQRTFRDPMINDIVRARFIPVRLERSTDNLDLLAYLGAPTSYGGFLVVASPAGESLGLIGADAAAEPLRLAQALADKFRAYRDQVYKEQLKSILEDKAAKPAALQRALRTIRDMIITSADADVAKLLEAHNLNRQVKTDIYNTLAVLSTTKSIDALYEAALAERTAADALKRATPAAADRLVPELKLDNDRQHLVTAYNAVTAIVGLPNPKPEKFWSSDNERVKEQELARAVERAKLVFRRWEKSPVAEFR